MKMVMHHHQEKRKKNSIHCPRPFVFHRAGLAVALSFVAFSFAASAILLLLLFLLLHLLRPRFPHLLHILLRLSHSHQAVFVVLVALFCALIISMIVIVIVTAFIHCEGNQIMQQLLRSPLLSIFPTWPPLIHLLIFSLLLPLHNLRHRLRLLPILRR